MTPKAAMFAVVVLLAAGCASNGTWYRTVQPSHTGVGSCTAATISFAVTRIEMAPNFNSTNGKLRIWVTATSHLQDGVLHVQHMEVLRDGSPHARATLSQNRTPGDSYTADVLNGTEAMEYRANAMPPAWFAHNDAQRILTADDSWDTIALDTFADPFTGRIDEIACRVSHDGLPQALAIQVP